MLERIVANTGQQPEQLITDAGYCSKAGQAIYALRKTIVEPMFGQIKGARGAGWLPVVWTGEGRWRMDPDGHHPEPPQVASGGA
jgi:hypothetical protein